MTTVREYAEQHAAVNGGDVDHLVAVWWTHGIEPTAEGLDRLWATFGGPIPGQDQATVDANPHLGDKVLVEPPVEAETETAPAEDG